MSKKKILITTEDTEKVENDPFTRKIIQCLARELAINNIKFSLEHPLPIEYKGVHLDCGYRIDVIVESEDVPIRQLILGLKSVEEIREIHKAQILTYMKLSNITTGLLINFNVKRLTDGIKRFKL